MLLDKKKMSWKELSRLFPASAEDAEKARLLFIIFEKTGYLTGGDLSLQKCSKAVVIDFFYRLSLIRSVESPVKRRKKSSWIHKRDFAFLNHRSLLLINEFPLFSQLSILPSIRTGAIILAPFTKNRKKELNTVDSHSVIDDDYEDKELTAMGISVEEQFHLFIEAIHLLGKCLGYSLDYRVARFAVPVLRRSDLFRWIDTNSSISYMEMLTEHSQQTIIEAVRSIVENYLNQIKTKPDENDYNRIRELIIKEGFWTIPSCSDGSNQLPLYETKENSRMPRFLGGDDNLTSFKFYSSGKTTNTAAMDYYSTIYAKWCDDFSFDFVKFNGIEYADDENMRKADSPSLDLIKKVIKKTTGKISHTGIVGATVNNPEQFLTAGFNIVFFQDSGFPIDRIFMERNFNLNRSLLEINRKKRKQLSIAMQGEKITDDSLLWLENSCRRIFISRFISCFDSYRPKYELWNDTAGNKNLSDIPLYNMIENIFTRYRDIMRKGKIVKHYADESVAWWIVHHGANLLIPVVSLDNNNNDFPLKPIHIDYSEIVSSSRILSVLEYDFTSLSGNLFLCGDEKIHCEDLLFKKFRLFSIQ